MSAEAAVISWLDSIYFRVPARELPQATGPPSLLAEVPAHRKMSPSTGLFTSREDCCQHPVASAVSYQLEVKGVSVVAQW